ncbi:MAG: hypothetical protein M1839_003308 [Geoglossum umbratile]|nr:MAG: hypothetical protein M1839_003308 [Geoglossum umbratile]
MIYAARNSVDLTPRFPAKLDEEPHADKKARDLTIDYLTKLRKHVVNHLSSSSYIGNDTFNTRRQEWVITVPAIWSQDAKNMTRACAEAAGIGGPSRNLVVISEPEAAAAYVFQKMDTSKLKVGDSIIVCDAGGGTVDLITYKITRLPPNLHVEESGICTGGKCGSVFLNRVFENWVDTRLGSLKPTLSDISRAEMMDQFETVMKKEFDGEDDDNMYFLVNGVPNKPGIKVSGNRMAITPAQMKGIFEVVVPGVINLVQSQKQQVESAGGAVSAILLVGGFGQSKYLFERLKKEFETQTLTVMRPPNP